MTNTSASHAVQVLSTQMNASMQRAIRDQRNYVETMEEQVVRDGNVLGFLSLPTDGEVLVSIKFSLSFLEKPLFTYGLEMAENTWVTEGNFPIHSATVTDWATLQPGDTTLWTGATLAIVTIGAMRSTLHYSFQGRTITAPVGTETSVGAPL